MNFEGMPILRSSVGLLTIFNSIDNGGKGALYLIQDPEIASKLYSLEGVEQTKYDMLAATAKAEFDIQKPTAVKIASTFDWIVQCALATVTGIIEFAFDIVDAVLEGVAGGLGTLLSGKSGILIIAAAGLAALYFLR